FRLALAYGGYLHVRRRVAPRLCLLETVKHTDDNPRPGWLAFDADFAAAADQIAATERFNGSLGMRRIVALERRRVTGNVDLSDDIGLGRARCFSHRGGGSAGGDAEDRGQRDSIIGFDHGRLPSIPVRKPCYPDMGQSGTP